MATRPSVIFHQLSVRPEDLPTTSVNFPCCRETFCQIHEISVCTGYLLSTSTNILYGRVTFRQLLTNFCAARRPSVKFLCRWETFRELPIPFREAGRPSVNFRQLFKWPEDFLSNFRQTTRPSVNFSCSRKIFVQFLSTFHAVGDF